MIHQFGKKIVQYNTFDEYSSSSDKHVRWGSDDKYPYFINEILTYSPVHSAAVYSKIDNICGRGFVGGENIQINATQNLNEWFKELVSQYVIQGNVFTECIWSKDHLQGLNSMYILPSTTMRIKKRDDIQNDQEDTFYYNPKWGFGSRQTSIVEYPALNPNDYTPRQIYHLKNALAPQYDYYSSPEYIAGINNIVLAQQITNFHKWNIINGGSGSLFINIPTQGQAPTQDEQEDMLRRMEDRFGGTDNAGNIMLSFSEDGLSPQITQIATSNNDEYYSGLYDQIQRQILSSHRVPSGLLLGLGGMGGLGSNKDEMETAYQLFQSTTIRPTQEFLINSIKPLMRLMFPDQEINLTIEQNTLFNG